MATQKENLTKIAEALRGRGHSGILVAKEFYSKIKQLPRLTPYKKSDPVWVGYYANQAVAVARTYWDARVSGSRDFYYSGGKTFYNKDTEDKVYTIDNEAGEGLIDCSTFVRLVLSGVDYLHSPYFTGNREDGAPRKDLYPWADTALAENNVRYAADLAEYFFLTGRVLDGFDDLRPGDIISHATPGSINTRFRCISHVSIVAEDCYDEIKYYNVTAQDKVVVRSGWASRNDYVFAARPDYEPARSYSVFDESVNLLTPPWYSISVYGDTTEKNGCKMFVSEDGRTLTAKGQPTMSTSFTLVSGNYPMYLRPGHYTLSGAPKRPDVNSGYSWGLVVRNADTDADCGWDLGNGAEFTLKETTPVKVYIYISSTKDPEGYVWAPKLTGREVK